MLATTLFTNFFSPKKISECSSTFFIILKGIKAPGREETFMEELHLLLKEKKMKLEDATTIP